MQDVVQPALDLFEFQLQSIDIEAQVHSFLEDEDSKFLIDELRTQQILINLIQNAINVSNSKDKIDIFIEKVNSDSQVVIEIRD